MKNLKKICVVGHFAFGKKYYDGQTVKAKELTKELDKRFGTDNVLKIDTHGGAKKLPLLIIKCLFGFKKSENVIMLPAHNGVKVLSPVFALYKKIFHRKIFYGVVGGWLPELIKDKPFLKKCLRSFDGILVETTSMKNNMENLGFSNIHIMLNFKDITPVAKNELNHSLKKPYRLCTFSRVMEEKGIADAVDVVCKLNNKYGETVYSLDIYGPIDDNQTEWFDNLKKDFPPYINYCGVVPFDKSVDVLKDYFALLFPTKFFTEGIPGTIVDALVSGIPVISSRWQNCADIVEDGYNGISYEFSRNELIFDILENIKGNPEKFVALKENCIDSSEKFISHNAINVLLELI